MSQGVFKELREESPGMDPLSLVDLDKIVEQAKTLIAIHSVSGSEQELVDWLENF